MRPVSNPDDAIPLTGPGETYNDLGGDYYEKRRNTPARQRRLVAQLEAIGHHVTVEPAA